MNYWPFSPSAEQAKCPIGQNRLKGTRLDPCVNPVKNAVKYARTNPCDPSTPPGKHMISAFWGRTIHNQRHLCRSIRLRATGQALRIACCAESARSRASRWPMILAG